MSWSLSQLTAGRTPPPRNGRQPNAVHIETNINYEWENSRRICEGFLVTIWETGLPESAKEWVNILKSRLLVESVKIGTEGVYEWSAIMLTVVMLTFG